VGELCCLGTVSGQKVSKAQAVEIGDHQNLLEEKRNIAILEKWWTAKGTKGVLDVCLVKSFLPCKGERGRALV